MMNWYPEGGGKGEIMEDQTGNNRGTTRIAWIFCVMRLKDWTETNGEANVQTCMGWTKYQEKEYHTPIMINAPCINLNDINCHLEKKFHQK